MLNMVLDSLDEGQELCAIKENQRQAELSSKTELTKECAMYIVSGELNPLYSYFSKRLKDYLPQEVFYKIWEDSILGLGDYLELGETTRDIVTNAMYEIYYQILVFEKMKIQLKFVYNENTIMGLWINYVGV